MGKKSIEDKFSKEIDDYFNGIEGTDKVKDEEYNDLLKLGKVLADKDFSKDSNKKAVLNKALKNRRKKSSRMKHPATVAASFALVGVISISLMQTTFAQNLVEKVIEKISLGHITAIQTEPSKTEEKPISDELKGKIFDEDGKPLEVMTKENFRNTYTAEGEKIHSIRNGEITTVTQKEKMDQEQKLKVIEPKKLNDYACFNVILPSYLPEGYKFDRAEFYKDEGGVVSSKYIDIYFTNEETGKIIYMQQRFADEETAFEMSADKIEEVKINGVDAIICDDRSLDWEVNSVLYMVNGRGEVSKSELVKIAESIK